MRQEKLDPIENNDYVGGNYISALNFSATLPALLPSFQNMDFSIFVDAANVWGVDYDSALLMIITKLEAQPVWLWMY